jgi:hypothetical protein
MRTLGSPRAACAGSAAGATTIELVVALALFGVVGAAVLRSLDRQARFHHGIVQRLEARTQLAATHDLMAAELRAAALAAGDIERATDSSLVYRQLLGAGLACSITAGAVDLGPDRTAAGLTLSGMRSAPQAGDTAWLFDEGARDGTGDDAWHAIELRGAARRADTCAGTPFVDPVADAGAIGWRLLPAAGSSIPAGVRAGAPVRLTRKARFALYRGASGDWSLGWTEWNPATGTFNVIQPVSGPFLAYNRGRPPASGVALGLRDSLQAASLPGAGSPGADVGALDVATRLLTTRVVRMDGVARGRRPDSLRSLVAFRNRR